MQKIKKQNLIIRLKIIKIYKKKLNQNFEISKLKWPNDPLTTCNFKISF